MPSHSKVLPLLTPIRSHVLSFRKHWRLFFLLRQDSLTRSGSKSKVLADICNHCFAWVILSTKKSGKNIPKLSQRYWTPAQPRGRNTILWFGIQSFGNRGCVLLGKIQELFLFPLSCCLNNRLCFVKCLRNQGGASERSYDLLYLGDIWNPFKGQPNYLSKQRRRAICTNTE